MASDGAFFIQSTKPRSAVTSQKSCLDNADVSSPRSTVLLSQERSPMTTNVSVMNETTVRSDSEDVNGKKVSPTGQKDSAGESGANGGNKMTGDGAGKGEQRKGGDDSRLTPNSHGPGAQLTHQPQVGAYYIGYPPAEPPSPANPGMTTVAYDAASFFQQPGAAAFGAPHTAAFGAGPGGTTPLSPPRGTNAAAATMGVTLQPASPLFPRAVSTAGGLTGAVPTAGLDASGQQRPGGAPPSPNLPYMSTQLYQPYPMPNANTTASQSSDNSPDDANSWNERSLQHQNQSAYAQTSPQMQGMAAMTYTSMAGIQNRSNRTYSFEDTMLPPSVLEQQEQTGNPQYSPYSAPGQSSPIPANATLFAHQSWPYGGPPDVYGAPGSPLQPRPTAHPPQMGMYAGGAAPTMNAGMRGAPPHMAAPYGQYYPASSPGPPIQTTASNKGPDGANLFIFHIPNHFTNLDMYQLFCPYGNLLSVRIMVEKDTGRSRGFGFVSYDSPESAALAIKELNGFAIGNKRLKVQHKQIRPKDLRNEREGSPGAYGMPSGGGPDGYPRQFTSSLPPSGPMAAAQNMWYDNARKPTTPGGGNDGSSDQVGTGNKHDEGTDRTSTSTGAESQLQLGTNESPLASLGTLQNALPDVPGKGGASE